MREKARQVPSREWVSQFQLMNTKLSPKANIILRWSVHFSCC